MNIYQGAAGPLRRPLETAQHIHGQDGMGDIGLELGENTATGLNAANAIVDAVHSSAEPLEVITLGPLTNIALALRLDPSILHRIRRITIRGWRWRRSSKRLCAL